MSSSSFFCFFFFLFRGTGRQERFLTRREMLRSSQKTWSRHPVTSPVLFCQLGARCWLMHSHTHTLYTHYTRIFLSPKRSESMLPGGSVCKGELKRWQDGLKTQKMCTSFHLQAWSVVCPKEIWNCLPHSVRHSSSLCSFQSNWKTHLFCLLIFFLLPTRQQ